MQIYFSCKNYNQSFKGAQKTVIPVRELKACAEQNMKLKDIAEKFHTTTSNICKRMQDYGITSVRQNRRSAVEAKIKELVTSRGSVLQAAEATGIDKRKVWGLIEKLKLFPIETNSIQRRKHVSAIKQMLKNGKTTDDIALTLEIPPIAVNSYIDLYGLSNVKSIEKSSDSFKKPL